MADIISKHGPELKFPKDIIWLGGAPGAGKGTNTGFIMRERSLTAPPIVVSSLLNTPEMSAIKASGGMVGDKECIELLLAELLKEDYEKGTIVDGIPRTKVQAGFVMRLNDYMLGMLDNLIRILILTPILTLMPITLTLIRVRAPS